MHRVGLCFLSLACLVASTRRVTAEPPLLVSCDERPAAVTALAAESSIDAFGVDPESDVAVVAIASPGDPHRSVLRFTKGKEAPRDVKLAGRVSGLAVTPDGKSAYVIVRTADRKGIVRNADLVRVDLESARVMPGATLPVTASGLALGRGGTTLLVAAKNEIRTFYLPALTSGPLYRAIGDNVGVAPIEQTSVVYVAQSSRIVLADLAAPQDRDGLALSEATPAPAPLSGLLTSTGQLGPLAVSPGGQAWCVRAGALAPPPLAADALPAAASEQAPPVAAAQTEPIPTPAEVVSPPVVAVAVTGPDAPPSAPAPTPGATEVAATDTNAAANSAPDSAPDPAPAAAASEPPPAAPALSDIGTVTGEIAGPSVADVAAIVLLGPDNVLREAARVVPDEKGRFSTSGLPPGAYRIVAAGKGGRVLICEPPFVSIRVGPNGAVEAPVMKVLRAQ